MELVNVNLLLVLKLIDENGRVFISNIYIVCMLGKNKVEKNGYVILIDIILLLFDIVDYCGFYVSVWISDEKNWLVKSLVFCGIGERWLGELCIWW